MATCLPWRLAHRPGWACGCGSLGNWPLGAEFPPQICGVWATASANFITCPRCKWGKLTRESRFLPLSNQRRHTRDAFNGMIIMILVNTSSFPRATHCARCFPCIHLVHPLKGPLQERSERVSDLPEVTQQASGRGSLGPRQAASRSPRPQSPELNGSPPPTPSSGVCFEVCSLPGI